MMMKTRAHCVAIGIVCVLSGSGMSRVHGADDGLVERGRLRYVDDCAGCHGAFAHGDGEVAKVLTISPSDLTVLSQGNGGQFPEDYVRRAIDGRDLPPAAHGQIAMPVWGRHYQKNLLAYSEEIVQGRLDELVAYLKSIQAK
jgi:hypothetical protein